jgi:hypothetical protein
MLVKCIEICNECADACEEDGMDECAKICRECAKVCELCAWVCENNLYVKKYVKCVKKYAECADVCRDVVLIYV